MPKTDPDNPLIATISLAEWLAAKTAYQRLRLALCDIEGGVPTTLEDAKRLATEALTGTPPRL